jgi:hypothetical protein
MSNEIIIDGKPIKVIEWQGIRVFTTHEIALFHDLEVRVINQKFRRNQKYFIQDIDFFIVKTEYLRSRGVIAISNMDRSDEVYFFTESGYLRFVKTINDDKAWKVYNNLVESYFLIKRLNVIEQKFLEKSKENRKDIAAEWSKHDAKNYGMLTISEYEALFENTSIRKKNMNDKELSLLSAFEFLETRKLENNPEIKGDKKLKISLKNTGLKINEIIKPKRIK